MSIRRTLLLTLIAFSVSFAALMTALSYSRARAALSGEIRLNLETQALTVMQQIEAVLFERVKNVQGWRRLDVMQEARVGDVDKRLARFLDDIKAAYAGVYTDLYCVQHGRVTASSDAAMIGASAPLPDTWLEIQMRGGPVRLSRPLIRGGERVMLLQSALRDAFTAEPLGHLVAAFDWSEISRLLDQAVAGGPREALLVDADGRPLAASGGLRAHVEAHELDVTDWHLSDAAHGVITIEGRRLARDQILLGFAHSSAYKGLPNLGWSLLVVTSEQAAFAPVRRLLWSLLALLAATAAVAALLAVRISARGARPLQELTRYTREIGHDIDTPMRNIDGTTEIRELSAAFNRTIEDLRRSRAQLVRASKLAAVGEMAAMLAHEVRTPLGIIRSSAQLIGRQGKLDEEGREMMSFMIQECDRINGLVTSLLEAARPHCPRFQPQDVNAIVRRVLEMLQARLERRRVDVAFRAAPELPLVACDRDQMVQVLLNVVMNAAQVVEDGGRIRIATLAREGGVELQVDDDGPGVPPARRESVFEPFVSYRSGGIGLGLPVVREIVEMHGGSVRIEDSELGGARFVIRLPAEEH